MPLRPFLTLPRRGARASSSGAPALGAPRILGVVVAAGVLGLAASFGGGWGAVAGQTAGPPPTLRPTDGQAPLPEVTPPAAEEYRPRQTAIPGTTPTPGPASGTAPVAGETLWRQDTPPASGPAIEATARPDGRRSEGENRSAGATPLAGVAWWLAGGVLLAAAGLLTWRLRRR